MSLRFSKFDKIKIKRLQNVTHICRVFIPPFILIRSLLLFSSVGGNATNDSDRILPNGTLLALIAASFRVRLILTESFTHPTSNSCKFFYGTLIYNDRNMHLCTYIYTINIFFFLFLVGVGVKWHHIRKLKSVIFMRHTWKGFALMFLWVQKVKVKAKNWRHPHTVSTPQYHRKLCCLSECSHACPPSPTRFQPPRWFSTLPNSAHIWCQRLGDAVKYARQYFASKLIA